jgi:hypothetical protein
MEEFLMNHFKCPYVPSACDHSVFLEDVGSSNCKIKRWVECVDYQYIEDPATKKMRALECEEFKLIVDGVETVVKKGDLCVNSPSDWWEESKEFKK